MAAASDFDFVADEPRLSAKKTGAGKARKQPRAARVGLRTLWNYRTPLIGALALVGLLATILVNAMFLQRQRHAAPLLGSTIRIERPKSVARRAEKPASIAQIIAAPAPQVAAAQVPPGHLAPAPAEAQPQAKADDIGALLSDGALAAPALPTKAILAAQRELQKLGFSVKPNGHYGSGVRKAVETFQRRNHLPATGELTPKLRQLLAIEAGMSID